MSVGSPCSDEGTIGLIPTVTLDETVEAIHAAVISQAKIFKAPMIVWKDFPLSAEKDRIASRRNEPVRNCCNTESMRLETSRMRS
jgi:hypothetical protein